MRIIICMARRVAEQQETATSAMASAGRAAPGLVPSRRQYLQLKQQHPEAILLYRLGDFYETFDEDAKIVARDARITLTSRSFGRSGRAPMAGIPYHALNHYLGRLLAAGHTIAIAEQITPPGRGLVERAITRVLTPGTIAEGPLLPASENRYLAAVNRLGERFGLAWVDVSTGEFAVLETSSQGATARLHEALARLNPAECLAPDQDDDDFALTLPGHQTRLERWHFAPERAATALCRQFGAQSLAPYGCAELPAATGAAGAILAYLDRTNPALLPLLTGLRTEAVDRWVGLDAATRRNLELTHSFGTGGSRGSLLGVLDVTRTPMGARTLRQLIGQPLRDLPELRRRQALVGALVTHPGTRARLGASLTAVGDLERLVGRVTQGQATARDFLALATALRGLPALATVLASLADPQGLDDEFRFDPCADVLDLVEAGIEADADGGARIRPGFSTALDHAVAGTQETRQWLAGLERQERERTGIRSLKVGYNKVFGYYIEITRPNLALVPADYHRKQTVATGERYVTAPLKEAEAKLLAADEEISQLERAALARLAAGVTAAAARLSATAHRLARHDALLALAEIAARNGWSAPELTDSDELHIVGGRHPVVEASLAGESFIPNDCHLGGAAPRQLIVTGPNMGGKSTYLRQVGLIVLLAQIGSFVPAARANIGLVDRIFTRVGAHDDLARGQSTFMVEMVETATILHQATRHSLVILDEVGRGTGTDDGLAIARAVLEDIHGRIGARTLFATHYLELTTLAEALPGVANGHVAVLEREGRVIFLYAVRPGPADRAYGIHVARLAGLPPWVADRAQVLLHELARERELAAKSISPDDVAPARGTSGDTVPTVVDILARSEDATSEDGVRLVAEDWATPYQLTLGGFPTNAEAIVSVARALRELNLAELTPRQALDWLFEYQERLGGRS